MVHGHSGAHAEEAKTKGEEGQEESLQSSLKDDDQHHPTLLQSCGGSCRRLIDSLKRWRWRQTVNQKRERAPCQEDEDSHQYHCIHQNQLPTTHSQGQAGAIIVWTFFLHSQHSTHWISTVPRILFRRRLVRTNNCISQPGTTLLEAAGTSKRQEEATHKRGGLQGHDSEARGVDEERKGHNDYLVTSPSFKGCSNGEFQSFLPTNVLHFQCQPSDTTAGTWGLDLEREEFKEGPLGSTIREQQVSIIP